MTLLCRKLLSVAVAIALLAVASECLAKKKKKGKELGEAVVHVLDAKGAPVGGVEVVLEIERPDGSRDRRLGLTGHDGAAHFRDVRGDCVQVKASVSTEDADVEGKPRPCGARVEAFVVLPAAEVAPGPPAGPPEQESAGLAETVEYPEAVDVDDDPYLEPAPETPAPDEPAEERPPEIPPEEQPFELRGRIGPDFCVEIFYDPAEAQRTCDDTDVIGLGIELDAAFHFEEWFLMGVMIGYRYFGSQVVPLDAPEDDLSTKSASNHLLQAGVQLRLSWMLADWVFSVDAVPVGISHQVITLADDQYSQNEFFVTLTPAAAYRVGEASWVGVYVEMLQLMPWVHSDIFRPAVISAGVVFGTRLGPQPEPAEAEHEGEDGGEDEDGGALMRRRLGDI